MKDNQEVPPHACLKCGYVSDRVSLPSEDNTPMPEAGDFTMCLCCGTIMVFTKDLNVRLPNKKEKDQMRNNAWITQMQIARASVVGDKIKQRREKGKEETSL